jgi:hypothetical protein
MPNERSMRVSDSLDRHAPMTDRQHRQNYNDWRQVSERRVDDECAAEKTRKNTNKSSGGLMGSRDSSVRAYPVVWFFLPTPAFLPLGAVCRPSLSSLLLDPRTMVRRCAPLCHPITCHLISPCRIAHRPPTPASCIENGLACLAS